MASPLGAYILVEEMDNKLVNNYRAWYVLLGKKVWGLRSYSHEVKARRWVLLWKKLNSLTLGLESVVWTCQSSR